MGNLCFTIYHIFSIIASCLQSHEKWRRYVFCEKEAQVQNCEAQAQEA
jgi:hypothetical protein